MKRILQEMYWEFMEGNLSVILVPQRDPPNPGACLRVAVSCNCDWYRDLCGDFESARKRQYRHFKTRVKRREIERILDRLLHDRPTHGKYAEWLLAYAAEKKNNTNKMQRKGHHEPDRLSQIPHLELRCTALSAHRAELHRDQRRRQFHRLPQAGGVPRQLQHQGGNVHRHS